MAKSDQSNSHGPVRCAIYTRKSTSAGLEKEFNSLDAQLESCQHYIGSQAHLRWKPLPEVYSDGGFTGANTDRPGFQRLLEHVARGWVDVVVVYKVDRLSRSLLDFAKVMEIFNRHQVAFVSVTQNFSTADAMGRLTLNMLMSFAEFEREMITERVRDKVGAARRKGRWTGGWVPLGYEVRERKLYIVPPEAEQVREVFRWYLNGESAMAISQKLNRLLVPIKNIRKPRSHPWTKDLVLRMLRNHLYLGKISCRGEFSEGEHEAIVELETFEQVQILLSPKVRRQQGQSRNPAYLVRGTLRCGTCGVALTSASTHRNGLVHRYYRCTTRDKRGGLVCPTRQLPAEAIEAFVVDRLRDAISTGAVSQGTVKHQLDMIHEECLRIQTEIKEVGTGDEGGPKRTSLRWRLLELGQVEEQLQWLAKVLGRFEDYWKILSVNNQQRLIRLLVEEVRVMEDQGLLKLKLRDLSVGAVLIEEVVA